MLYRTIFGIVAARSCCMLVYPSTGYFGNISRNTIAKDPRCDFGQNWIHGSLVGSTLQRM